MSNEFDPIEGTWYRHLDKGQMFVVVSVDEANDVVEVQHFDGDVEEIELENWLGMELEMCEPPEDWSGPVDNLEPDDTDYSETEMTNSAWRENLEEYPAPARENWEDVAPEDERDDWAEGAPSEESRPQSSLEDSALATAAEEPGEEEQKA